MWYCLRIPGVEDNAGYNSWGKILSNLIIIKIDKFQKIEEELWRRTHKKGHNETFYTYVLTFVTFGLYPLTLKKETYVLRNGGILLQDCTVSIFRRVKVWTIPAVRTRILLTFGKFVAPSGACVSCRRTAYLVATKLLFIRNLMWKGCRSRDQDNFRNACSCRTPRVW